MTTVKTVLNADELILIHIALVELKHNNVKHGNFKTATNDLINKFKILINRI